MNENEKEEALLILVGPDLYKEIKDLENERERKGIKALSPITKKEMEVWDRVMLAYKSKFEEVLEDVKELGKRLDAASELVNDHGLTVSQAFKALNANGEKKDSIAAVSLLDYYKAMNKTKGHKRSQ